MQFLEPIGGTTGLLVIIAVLVILSNLANTRSRRRRRSGTPCHPNREFVKRPAKPRAIPLKVVKGGASQILDRVSRETWDRTGTSKPALDVLTGDDTAARSVRDRTELGLDRPNVADAEHKTPFVPQGVSYRRLRLLTKIEQEAFSYLRAAIGSSAHICAKVRVSDCLEARSEHAFSQTVARQKISMRHVDFVVIKSDGEICFAVEVDDSTHASDKSKEIDALKDHVFYEADIPLIRVEPYRLHESGMLKRAIEGLKV